MDNIEVEVRSFISKEQYEKLLEFFKRNSEFIKEDDQETFYFDCKEDLRIQRNNFFSKIWFKKGKIHDKYREEIEIKFSREDFPKLEALFLALGYNIQVKWFRKRFEFQWQDVKVSLDFTKGYGYIIELEKITSDKEKEKEYEALKKKLEALNINPTPKEEFDKKFREYKENWKNYH